MTFFTCKASEMRHCKRPFFLFCPSSCRDLGSAGSLTSPLGCAYTNLAAVFPLFCAEAVEKQIYGIFHIQTRKLGRWSLTAPSEGRKPLKTLHMTAKKAE